MDQDSIQERIQDRYGVYGPLDRERLPIGTVVTYQNVFYGPKLITGRVRAGWLEPVYGDRPNGEKRRVYYVTHWRDTVPRDHIVDAYRITLVHGPAQFPLFLPWDAFK